MASYEIVANLLGSEIQLYRLVGSTKGNLYCRFKNPTGNTTYVRRSLKTASESLATKRAIDMYNDAHSKVRLGAGVIDSNWDVIFAEFVPRLSERRQQLARDYNERWWKPFFGNKKRFPDLFTLDDRDIEAFWRWRIEYWDNNPHKKRFASKEEGKTSDTTLRYEAYTLKFILMEAFHKSYIGKMPTVIQNWKTYSQVSSLNVKHRRGRFEIHGEEIEVVRKWWRLTRRRLNATRANGLVLPSAEGKWKHSKDLRVIYNMPRNRYSIAVLHGITVLAANSGLRPYELTRIAWKDVQLHTDEDGDRYSVIQVRPEVSKVKKHRDVICRDRDVSHTRLMEFREEWIKYFGREPKPDELVFANLAYKDFSDISLSKSNRKVKPMKPHQSVRRWLLSLKDRSGKTIYYQNVEGVKVPRTLYSFRALYISASLARGLEPYTLCRNCGTSLEMLERHYDYNKNLQFRSELTAHKVAMDFLR
jgi:integrase